MSGDFPGAGSVEQMGAISADVDAEEASICDVYEIVAPLTPCYRRGVVLQAVSLDRDKRTILKRNAFEARELGLALAGLAKHIDAAITAGILAAARKVGIKLDSVTLDKEPVRSRFAPGLILDFAGHKIQIGRVTIQERTCVTVCYNESASKIWTRFIVSDVAGGRVTQEEAIQAFRFFAVAAREAMSRMSQIYLRAFIGQHSKVSNVVFETVGEIDFLGVDTKAFAFHYAASDSVGPIMSSSDIPDRDKDIFCLYYRELVSAAFPRRIGVQEKQEISPECVSLFRSEFGYCALYHGIFRADSVTFLVMGEPGEMVAEYGRPESGTLTVTAELAAMAVKKF
jgi:hypothetical protein